MKHLHNFGPAHLLWWTSVPCISPDKCCKVQIVCINDIHLFINGGVKKVMWILFSCIKWTVFAFPILCILCHKYIYFIMSYTRFNLYTTQVIYFLCFMQLLDLSILFVIATRDLLSWYGIRFRFLFLPLCPYLVAASN